MSSQLQSNHPVANNNSRKRRAESELQNEQKKEKKDLVQLAPSLNTCFAAPNFVADIRAVYACSPIAKCAGWTRLMCLAMCRSRIDEFVVLLAQSTAAEINAQNDDGWTALILAARNSRFDSHDKVVSLLIRAGAKLDLQMKAGYTAVHVAARYSRERSQDSTLQLLLQAGADANIRCATGWSPLMSSVRHTRTSSHDSTVQLLLQAGANMDYQANESRLSAIMIAAGCVYGESQYSTFDLLLQHGARVDLWGSHPTMYTTLSLLLDSETNFANAEPAPSDGLVRLVRASRRFPAIIAPYITAAKAASLEGLLFHRACMVIMQQDEERLSERAAFDRAVAEIAPIAQNLTGSNDTDALVKQYL